MLKHLEAILAEFNAVPNNVLPSLTSYLFSLMLVTRRHDAKQAADIQGCHESQISRFINRSDATLVAKTCLNRAARRRLAVLPKFVRQGKTPYCIGDATLTGRRGKRAENVGTYNHGKSKVRGHKITNFVMLLGEELIPIGCLAHYTPEYCRERGLDYKTEPEMIEDWINWFPSSGLVAKDDVKYIHFIFDCGYDVKRLQRAIRRIGSHFTMSIKSNRIVGGLQVREYFKRHRHLPWKSIRLTSGSGGKGSRRCYRTRHQARVKLKGFGLVTLVCSEVRRKSGKMSRKYLISSDHSLSARDIVDCYKKRWAIETWHKEMKQNHGYRDSRSSSFQAVEAHINFCLAAYAILGEGTEGLPRKGITATEFFSARQVERMVTLINLFGGREKVKRYARAGMERIAVG